MRKEDAAKAIEAKRQRVVQIVNSPEWAEFRDYCQQLFVLHVNDALTTQSGPGHDFSVATANAIRQLTIGFEMEENALSNQLATQFFARRQEGTPRAYRSDE